MNVQAPLNSALAVRDQFPAIPPGWHYLDSAATAQKPQAVIDAITQAYARDYATVHRGVYERSAAMTASYEAARAAASIRRAPARCCSKGSSWAFGTAPATAMRSATPPATRCGGSAPPRNGEGDHQTKI